MKWFLLILLSVKVLSPISLYATTPLFSGPIDKTTAFLDWPDVQDTSSSTDHILIPRAEFNVATGSGPMVILFCADIGFGPLGAPTDVGAMTIEVFIDGELAHPGTTMMAQNIGPQNECASFMNTVKSGNHVIRIYWRSLGGEQMFMGYRTVTVFHR